MNYQDAIKRIKSTGELADVSVSDVTPAVIRRWVVAATAEYSPKTVQNTFAVLSQVFKQAQLDGRIHANPCSGIKRPKVTRNPDLLVLNAAQVMAMAEEAGRYRAAVLLMALAGLRWSEMARLQRRDVNLDTGEIFVRRQLQEVKGVLTPGLPKHDKVRRVPVPAQLAQALAPLLDGEPTGLVMTTPAGTALRVGNARRDWFNAAAEAVGAPGLTPHDLRHTYASLAVQAGANPKQLQEATGHHSASFTLDVYASLFASDLHRPGQTLDTLFSTARGQNVVTNETRPVA